MSKFKSIAAMVLLPAAMGTVMLPGCATSPQTSEEKQTLDIDSDSTVKTMEVVDPSLKSFLDKSVAYVIFPSVGKGGAIVGGAYGRGIVYQAGMAVGYADLSQGSVGLQLGGETYAELIAFQTQDALSNFQSNKLEFGATASAIALKSGAAAEAKWIDGVAVFFHPKGGLMLDASINGQQFTYQAKTGK